MSLNSSPLRGSEPLLPLGRPPTYPVLRLPLSRKRRSWEHVLRLRFRFPPACRGKGHHGNMACACDSLSPLPVEETAIMGTWRALANPFSPCLLRKRQSWGACDSLFPLPVEEKGSIGPSRAMQRPRMTPPEHAKSPDCLFPVPVVEKAHSDFRGSPRAPPPLGSRFERFQAAI